jgi:hypothetical protein
MSIRVDDKNVDIGIWSKKIIGGYNMSFGHFTWASHKVLVQGGVGSHREQSWHFRGTGTQMGIQGRLSLGLGPNRARYTWRTGGEHGFVFWW